METVVILDAMAPSARLNAGYGVLGQEAPGYPPRFLFVTCIEVDTSHNHLLRAKLKDKDQPVVWVPYGHVIAMQQEPDPPKGEIGFRPS